jgi:hypothetical protein
MACTLFAIGLEIECEKGSFGGMVSIPNVFQLRRESIQN